MKKAIALFLSLMMVLGLAACGDQSAGQTGALLESSQSVASSNPEASAESTNSGSPQDAEGGIEATDSAESDLLSSWQNQSLPSSTTTSLAATHSTPSSRAQEPAVSVPEQLSEPSPGTVESSESGANPGSQAVSVVSTSSGQTTSVVSTSSQATPSSEPPTASRPQAPVSSQTPVSSQAPDPVESIPPAPDRSKVLVVYFSATGNTAEAAQAIAAATGADLFELVPTDPYTSADLNWTDDDSRVVYEHDHPQERNVELVADRVDHWDEYDVVFIGYPIWWGIAAWPVDTFVEANDFTGKRVIPFCTSSSSGLGESGELLAQAAGTGDWLEGRRFSSNVSESAIQDWIDSLNL